MASCTRDIIDQTIAGHQAGADFALVLIPSLFHWAITQKAIVEFFLEVADRSPIPIIIYNFPRLLSGLEVDSDMLETISAHPNMKGVKLTCGGIAKITRVIAKHPHEDFATVAGQSDLIVSALAAGGSGCISGVANLFPRVSKLSKCVHHRYTN